MNRKLKRISALFLTLAMLLLVLPGQLLTVYAASGKITFSDPSASVGNQVSVNMKIALSDGTGLGNSDVMLEYDASALEFVSGTNANGGAGSVRVVGSMESANQTTFSFTLKFKALKAGTTSITVKSQEVYDADSRPVSIEHVGNSSIKVNASESASKDAGLSSLTISPGSLHPAFSEDVTEYTATVSGTVDKITVSAPAKDGKASVSVQGADNLVIGENEVVCKVTAEDGTTSKTYTIRVTKVEGEAPENTETNGGSESSKEPVNVQEGNWTAADTFDASLLPEGFTVTDYVYGGKTIQAGVNDKGVTLIYMNDENGNGEFFVYDAETGVLAPYITVRMAEKMILVLPPEDIPEGTELPENFKPCTIDIGEHTVNGWIYSKDTEDTLEYCILYGQNADGEKNFYRYDQKEMTLQRYFQDPDAAELRKLNSEVIEKYNSLVEDYNVRGYIVAGLFGVCILLLIVLIILLLTRKPKNTSGPGRSLEDPVKGHRTAQKTNNIPERRSRVRQAEEDPDFEYIEPVYEKSLPEKPLSKKQAPVKPEPAAKEPVVKEPEELDDDFEFVDLDK